MTQVDDVEWMPILSRRDCCPRDYCRRDYYVWCEIRLPFEQIGEKERRATELPIQEDAEIMQGDGGGQIGLKAG